MLRAARLGLSAAAVAASTAASAGCGGGSYPAAQWAGAPSADGLHFWVVGRYGFAAEGQGGVLRRADFPRSDEAPDWAWDGDTFPAGHVVDLTGRTYLITLGGNVLRRDAGAWADLGVPFFPDRDEAVQVDDVLPTADGGALVHVHATDLFWVDGPGLERGLTRHEDLPHYFTWLGFVQGELLGLGWVGEERAVLARRGVEQWATVAVLPKTAGEPMAIAPFGEHRRAVVVDTGLIEIDAHGGMTPVPVGTLLAPARAPLVIATDEGPSPAALPTPPRPAEVAGPAPVEASSPEPLVVGTEVPAPAPLHPRVVQALKMGTERVALVVTSPSGAADTVLMLGGGAVRRARCELLGLRLVVGVVTIGDVVQVVTTRASVVAILPDGSCSEVQAPLLPEP